MFVLSSRRKKQGSNENNVQQNMTVISNRGYLSYALFFKVTNNYLQYIEDVFLSGNAFRD